MHSNRSKEPSILILLLLTSLASVSALICTPALPAMSESFGINVNTTQLVMTIFLVGYSLGHLPYGPIANRFGRKPTLFAGLSLAVVGALMILIASLFSSFVLLLAGRFLSALGASVGLKISFTMLADRYQPPKLTKKVSTILLSFSIAPGLSALVGGFLTSEWGWQSCFSFLTAYTLLLLCLSWLLPETTLEIDHEALDVKKVALGYMHKFRNKKFLLNAFIMGAVTSYFYIFATLAPFIGISELKLTPKEYGLMNIIPPLGMIGGFFLSNRLAGKKEPLLLMRAGNVLVLTISCLMFLLFQFGVVSSYTLFFPMVFIFIGLALIFSTASTLALTHAKNKSNASAVMNFINIGVGVCALLILESLPHHRLYLPLSFLLLSCGIFYLFFLLKKADV